MHKLLLSIWMGGVLPALMSSASLPAKPDGLGGLRGAFQRVYRGPGVLSSREVLPEPPVTGPALPWAVLQERLVRRDLAAAPQLRYDLFDLPFKTAGLPKISSGFGMRPHPKFRRQIRRRGWEYHKGWDLPQRRGTPVYPSRSGKVVFAGWKTGYGQMVELEHADGQSSVYGHLGRILVRKGDQALAGSTPIGKVGSTGRSTGAHLHFELRDAAGKAVDPAFHLGRR